MWIWMTLASALFLGAYDVAKKKAIEKNDIYHILLVATALSALFLSPFLSAGSLQDHAALIFKSALVCTSWVCGMIALKLLPITMVSSFKASRPMFVVLFSMILYGERLTIFQWAGVLVILTSLYLLSLSGAKEGIHFVKNKGVWAMFGAILSGVASALFDKQILAGYGMEPLFVQSWTNVYIALWLLLIIAVRAFHRRRAQVSAASSGPAPSGAHAPVPGSAHSGADATAAAPAPAVHAFRWDWTLLAIAILITAADMLYFFALKDDGALLSVVSLLRRSSTIVTFVLGALIFRERRIGAKAAVLALMLCGVVLLALSSL